jgi:prenyltransferase beta subunit
MDVGATILILLIQDEVTPAVHGAVDKGLEFLARTQAHNGSFGNGAAPVATTALCGLAFLAAGHVPGRSRYTPQIRKCIQYLLKCTSRMGYINEGAIRGQGGSGMHGHGYALLFLSQVYGMQDGLRQEEVEEIRDAVTRAVRVTEQAQAPNGGWLYDPAPRGDEGSVTVTQVQALRAVHNSGIRVNLKTIEKAIEYIHKTTNEQGHTAYSLSSAGSGVRPTLTAAGMCVLTYLGEYDSPKIGKGLDYLIKNFRPGQGVNVPGQQGWGQWWFFYANYYATVAMYQRGGEYWRDWWPAVRDSMVKAQSEGGSWRNSESQQYGEAFGTALALLTLQIPSRLLPIFQRAQD